MTYSTHLLLTLSILPAASLRETLQNILGRHREQIGADLSTFLAQECSPTHAFDLERRLAERLRDLGRDLLESLYNRLEGDDPHKLPSHLRLEGEDYRIVRDKTRHAVDTLFGPIALERHLYRPVARDSAEQSIAPVERVLGVVEGATPALAEAAARYAATAGASQRQVQDQLSAQHGVTIGTKRLRALLEHVSGTMAEARQDLQAQRLLALLARADTSPGRTKPVLTVSRDGISLRKEQYSLFEVATTATVTVSDRRGQRLGTVYLAFAPELGQQQMTDQLTGLIEDVLRCWEGPVPRLAYVTDAGDNETAYFERVLRPMVHPRTGEQLAWQRIVDFYHAMERVWKLADVLFASDPRGRWSWGRRMGRLLKKANGPFRVLHAAAALKTRRMLHETEKDEYRKAYNYIRTRTQWMQYWEYARVNLPLGSGIVEAACKTIYTQRLKLSGMRWSKAGAQVILNLRVVLLSGVWGAAYRQTLTSYIKTSTPTPNCKEEIPMQMAG
jgi:hypothetical protein